MSLGNNATSNQGANDGEDEVDAIFRHSEKRFHQAYLGILDTLRELVNPTRRAVEEEALFNGELQSSRFLYEGNKACKFVGKVFLQNGNQGTGTLVAERRILLTAAHIFKNCKEGEVSFERVDPERSFYQMSEVKFALEPDKFFQKHPDSSLDIALIAVSERSLDGETPISEVGSCRKFLPSIAPGTHVNIIQYPENGNQMVVLRQNQVLHYDESFLKLFSKDFVEHHRYETRRRATKKSSWKFPFRARENAASSDTSTPFLHYRADTKHGSSGAPCFDDQWNLIGFHHCALLVKHRKNPNLFTYEANEGVRIDVVAEWADNELDGYDDL